MALADSVAGAALAAYGALPNHGKPGVRSNGVPEWTVLAAMGLVLPRGSEGLSGSLPEIRVVSIGTGVKVLPAVRLPPLGDTVHDSHAEVLARRGFRRWLIHEASRVARGEASGVLERQGDKFTLVPGVEVWLYVSALPVCVVLASADLSVATPQLSTRQPTSPPTWLRHSA